jgi:hypothetical protein
MISENQESVQLLNTAIIKSKEKKIDNTFENRLAAACSSPEMEALSVAIAHLAEKQKISRDQAAISLIERMRELDSIWNDYVMMEGISNLKDLLGKSQKH